MNPNPQQERPLVSELQERGAQFRFRRSGLVHTADLSGCTDVGNAEVARLRSFTRLAVLNLKNASLDGSALEYLLELSRLESLDLQDTPVGDEASPHLEQLGRLKILILTGTKLSQETLRVLRKKMLNTRIVFLT